MSESIVIIDSSDDENNPGGSPKKKMKKEHLNGVKNEDQSFGLKITQVTSLADDNVTSSNCDVIEIDSDENESRIRGTSTKNLNTNDIVKWHENNKRKTETDISTEECTLSNKLDESKEKNIDNKISQEFKDFLDLCVTCLENGKYKDLIVSKIESIKNKYVEADPEYTKSKSFFKLIKSYSEKIKSQPTHALMHFKTVYEELKSRKFHDNVTLNEKQEFYISKLRKAMRLLDKKIKKLEEKEVDFDDDNESTYIMLDRYKRKFVQVHKKYCCYTKEDSYAGRITHRKLDFNVSDYSEINRAIDLLYIKTKKFPLYHEVDECVRKCVAENNINLNDIALELEIKKIHQEMGKLVQRRRRFELEDIHNYFLGSSLDPALENTELNSTLEMQAKIGEQKMDEIFETFTKRQLQGDDPPVSSDTDDSNIQSDQEETKNNE